MFSAQEATRITLENQQNIPRVFLERLERRIRESAEQGFFETSLPLDHRIEITGTEFVAQFCQELVNLGYEVSSSKSFGCWWISVSWRQESA